MSFSAVHDTLPQDIAPRCGGDQERRLARLQQTIEHAAHLLPAQGPITVFIHHNTLHALEDLPFDQGVKAGGRILGCQPYLPEARYREKLARGRIRLEDLSAARSGPLRISSTSGAAACSAARCWRPGWVQLAVLNLESCELQVYQHGQFESYQPETADLPRAPSSADWYRGWRDHLGDAQIGVGCPGVNGDGVFPAQAHAKSSVAAGSGLKDAAEPQPMPPLPVGEGWGEGKLAAAGPRPIPLPQGEGTAIARKRTTN